MSSIGACFRRCLVLGAALWMVTQGSQAATNDDQSRCEALLNLSNLTITRAEIVEQKGNIPAYCHVIGTISPAIRYHVQLPLPANWNGRYLNWGDGGKDGDLDYADERLDEGYAVSNSNTGHDSGSEPGASFAYNNRQAEIDFGYRAVHLTVDAAKTIVKAYYGKAPDYSYHEGCSTGGRQGLMEAQRFPTDFDGIVAGAPVAFYQELHSMIIWASEKLYANHFAGNLAFDKDGDGQQESLTKLHMLASAVLKKCDAIDGIKDGVIDDPRKCDFDPEKDLKGEMCKNDVNGDACFTTQQVENIKAIYGGIKDAQGRQVYKGMSPGSELAWLFVPTEARHMQPFFASVDHMNYLFYEHDPGVEPPNPADTSYPIRHDGAVPQWGWWEFDVNDLLAGKADFMKRITDATDPDMRQFLVQHGGKLLMYHGWADANAAPEPMLDYYKDVIGKSFDGDVNAARKDVRMFMAPGMFHCRGGPGPNEWDRLAPLVDWVEHGKAPDQIVARHSTNGKVDNERPLCAYPQTAHYTGPSGGQNDSKNWVAKNFTCK